MTSTSNSLPGTAGPTLLLWLPRSFSRMPPKWGAFGIADSPLKRKPWSENSWADATGRGEPQTMHRLPHTTASRDASPYLYHNSCNSYPPAGVLFSNPRFISRIRTGRRLAGWRAVALFLLRVESGSISQHSKLGRSSRYSPSKLPFRLIQTSASRQSGQTSSTRAQKRAEWFISRRCINSW